MFLRKQKERIMAYFNKDEFENVRGKIDPLEYHSVFVRFASYFSVIYYEKMSMWMYIFPIFSYACSISGGALFLVSFVHHTQKFDIQLMTESGTYLMLLIYQFFVTYSVTTGRKKYHSLIRALRDDFGFICTTGEKYRKKFFENQKLTFKACILGAIIMFFSCTTMAACAIVGVAVARHTQEPGAPKPMPFPIWLFGYDVHTTPLNEIIFLDTMVLTFCYTFNYIFILETHIMWIRTVTSKADIIIWKLEDLLVDVTPARNKEEMNYYAALINHRMKGIVEMHQDMFRLLENYASVGKKCFLFEQIISAPAICMTAFCIVEKYEAGESQALLLPLCIGMTITIFIPNYLGTHLLEKTQSISDACWNTPFWNAGPFIRPYLILVMMRSLRPLPIAAPGLAEISLKTYANTLTRAYSGFNMLRQIDLDFN